VNGRQGDRGMVTAEFAVALPAFVLVVAAAICGVAAMTAQLRCVDAADLAARMAARGEPVSVVRTTALGTAPADARLTLTDTATEVTATVRARLAPPGLSSVLPGIVVAAQVVDALEPGVGAVTGTTTGP
jgi:Flp pilus assembly protein TadG